MEPLFPEVTVLLGDRVAENLLKCRALQGVHLIFREGGGGGILKSNLITAHGNSQERPTVLYDRCMRMLGESYHQMAANSTLEL